MWFLTHLLFLVLLTSSTAKITYFNLENIYGPYCNPQNIYTPDAGIVRYAGTPWTGKCELNLHSTGIPMLTNITTRGNLSSSTRFFIHLLKAPLCTSERVVVQAEGGETIIIDCNATDGSEYYLNTERVTIIYYRTAKLPLSEFSMVVTPLKIKTRVYSLCGFDCFSDTYCIDRSLVCDRYRNCPDNVDEANCDYSHHRPPISFRSKILLLTVLITIITFDVSSILICYFCCGISNSNRVEIKDRKMTPPTVMEEGAAAVVTPLLQSSTSKSANQCN